MSETSSFPLLATARPAPRYLHAGRRALSLGLGTLALVPGLALSLPIALINTVLHGGPRRALFRQARVGRDGRIFQMWKFRTMRDSDDDAFERWRNEAGEITRFGRFLRRSHLDELPQLWNVLVGDMDLVGPRPEMVEVHRWAKGKIPGFYRRNAVRPGLTGLAQVTQGYAGMDVEAYRAKLAADLEYLQRASLPRDLGLIARTLGWVVGLRPFTRGAAR